MKVTSLSCVRHSATPWTATSPGSSVHGVFQAGVLEWGSIAFPDKADSGGAGSAGEREGGLLYGRPQEGPFDKMLSEHSPKPSEGEPGGCGEAGSGDGRCQGPGEEQA